MCFIVCQNCTYLCLSWMLDAAASASSISLSFWFSVTETLMLCALDVGTAGEGLHTSPHSPL